MIRLLMEEYEAEALTGTEYERHRWNPLLEKWILDDAVPSEHIISQA
jgi:hypothetical protein